LSTLVPSPVAAGVEIRRLGVLDVPALLRLASGSDLPTLTCTTRLLRLLLEQTVLGAFLGGELAGCACVERDVEKRYVDDGGYQRWFPLPNAYLCGAYVSPRQRGRGIGNRLYASRLALARDTLRGTAVVELIGSGQPRSVRADALVGLRFYLREGFVIAGHSIDADGGLVVAAPLHEECSG
jgi:GNAT superfamily N-acetyltransferase